MLAPLSVRALEPVFTSAMLPWMIPPYEASPVPPLPAVRTLTLVALLLMKPITFNPATAAAGEVSWPTV